MQASLSQSGNGHLENREFSLQGRIRARRPIGRGLMHP